jgi:Uma2 family endonuclease
VAIPEPRDDYKYTYADYLAWPDDERWEIIEGVPYDMSPAPNPEHQLIQAEIIRTIGNFLKGKKCRLYPAPFDVRFCDNITGSNEDVYTIVQPDISIVCDNSKIDKHGCKGAPDICIEILSPSTANKDQTEKFKLYEKYKVQEYWIVNPDNETIIVYKHNGTEYDKPVYYENGETLLSDVLPGLKILLSEVFSE